MSHRIDNRNPCEEITLPRKYTTNVSLFKDGTSMYRDGSRAEYWYDRNGSQHRNNGLPAIISSAGHEYYYIHGLEYKTAERH